MAVKRRNFNCHLHETLRRQLKASAEREVRPLHGEIIARLRKSFPEGSGAPHSAARDHGEIGA